jgi:hypothetical protein
MPESIEQKDVRQAEERGRRQQIVDGRLNDHDRRLNAINGSIERGAKATEAIQRDVGSIMGKLRTSEEVAKALARATERAAASQVSRRDWWIGVALVMVALFGVFVQAAHV